MRERQYADAPFWRKKVDSLLLRDGETPLPNWICSLWGIYDDFSSNFLDNGGDGSVKIKFQDKEYVGKIRIAVKNRDPKAYRLCIMGELHGLLRKIFIMSSFRYIESRLRGEKCKTLEEEIPFWEFLDIEYIREYKTFYFTAHYTQKSYFPKLFNCLVENGIFEQIYDRLD